MSNANSPPASPPENALSKSGVWVKRHHFYGAADPEHHSLLVGFDTEFKTPSAPVSNEEIREGQAKYEVLSYQVHCRIFDPAAKLPEVEWSGILYPEKGERITVKELLQFAIAKGVEAGTVATVPTDVVLIGHFTRADVPAFADFKRLVPFLDSVRNTLLTLKDSISVSPVDDDPTVTLKVDLRDTILLAPEGFKSLADIGSLVGIEKLTLDPDPVKEQFFKENMDQLMVQNPSLFEAYALRDAEILTCP